MSLLLLNHSLDIVLGKIFESLGNPPLIMLDIRPLNYAMAIIGNHEVAEQVSRASKIFPYSLPKSPTMTYIDPLVGHHSLVSIQVGDSSSRGSLFRVACSIPFYTLD